MHVATSAWALFAALVFAMLAIDLAFDARERRSAERTESRLPQSLTLRAAGVWSAAWIGLGLLFGLVVLALYDAQAMVTYYTAYVLEKSLSVDNLFVFALIFDELAIPAAYQRRVLYWGILGALATRALLIAAGVSILDRFHWAIYPFGVLVLLAAARLLFGEKKERKVLIAACAACGSWVARFIPVTPVLRDGKFWIRQSGRLAATPLFIALIIIELSDMVFSLDSIPAVLAITRVPFLVYTSNVFAMLGLRSLYFLLAGAVARFHALRYALAAILLFVSAKMLLSSVVDVPSWLSLAVVIVVLAVTVVVSLGQSKEHLDDAEA
jgi:tellurite resistance protein TerC